MFGGQNFFCCCMFVSCSEKVANPNYVGGDRLRSYGVGGARRGGGRKQVPSRSCAAVFNFSGCFCFRVFLLSMQLCTVRVCWAQHRVALDLPGMDAAMETSAMQMLVLILAATSPIEDVDGFAQKLHKMIPALYHLHSLITQDRTELLQNLRLLCCVLTSARNWMERALPSSSSAGMRLVDTGLCPRRACQGSIVGNLELYIPEDGVELVEVRSAIETFRELYAWREWRCWHKEPFDMSRFKELPTWQQDCLDAYTRLGKP